MGGQRLELQPVRRSSSPAVQEATDRAPSQVSLEGRDAGHRFVYFPLR